MAQIIKHRRGSLEALSAVTSSLQKGEIVIASGSSNLTVSNGTSIVFAVPEAGQVRAVNRVLRGTNAPSTFAAGTYNGLVDGVPYYASASATLYLLGSDVNEAINLVGNIQPFSTSVDSRLDSLETAVGGGGGESLGTRVANLEITSASVNTFTASVSTSVGLLQSSASYLNTTFSTSVNSRLVTVEAVSASSATALSASAASVNDSILSLSTSVDSRLDVVEAANTRQASTGSNVFFGDQVITGSVYVTANLVVQGSSSLQNITASAVNIGTNTVILNTATPAVRYGGISVQDSGSANGRSGSLFWDSINDYWVHVTPSGSSEGYNSSILISGPKNSGSLGSEAGLATGYIQVAVGEDHIGNSLMSQSAGLITLAGDFKATGEISSSTIAGLGNATSFSTSVDSRLDVVEASLGGGGSIGSRVANLETISASYLEFTSSYYTTSGSIASRLATVELVSASAATALSSFSASNATIEATQNTSITAVFASASAYSASLATTISNLGSTYATDAELSSVSGAIATRDAAQDVLISSLQSNILSASVFTTFSTSVDSRLDSVELVSASAASALNSFSASNATIEATQNTSITAAFASASAYSASAAVVDIAQDVKIASLETNILSASIFNTFSTSVDTRLDTLEATTFSTSVDSRLDAVEATASKVDTAFTLSGQNVTVKGNLTVQGTTTQVDSTIVNINDNILTLNAAGTSDGGIIVKDATGATTNSGSLLYDVTNDYWKAGASGSEHRILTVNSGVVSGSSQITLSSTTGYTTFSSSIATSDSASLAIATSYSASLQSTITSLSTSVDSRLDTLEGNVGQAVNTNSNVTFNSVTSSVNLGSTAGNTKRIAFRNTNGTLDLVPTASVSGDLLQWDGSDFVMSNTIDGGSF